MRESGRLTGQEAEAWVKEFTKRTYMLSKNQYPLEGFVRLLESELSHRFKNGRLYIYKDLPEGDIWINTILSGKNIESIGTQNRQDLSEYLMDKVVATDIIVELRDNNTQINRISIDVTIDPAKQEDKLGRVRGKPEKNDPPGYNQNSNLPSVRKKLGIDKHLVLVLNSDRQKLPSYEYLLTELFAFANQRSQTKIVNLLEVPENQRFKWNEIERLDPKKMWDNYSRGIQRKDKIEISNQASLRAIRAGYDRLAITEMLKHDPQYQHLAKYKPEVADNYPKTIYASARKRLELEKAKDPTHQEINIQALKMGRFIIQKIGKEKANGEKVAPGKLLTMRQNGDDLKIEATSDKRVVVEYKAGSLKGNPTSAELEWLEGWTKAIKADKQRSVQKTKDPGFDITR
jgi:hypothetical protein